MICYPDFPRVAVGACVFKDHCVLLVRRANPPSAGDWTIPGGTVELGETLGDAARREILEETGIAIEPGDPVYTFDFIEKDPNGGIRFHYVIIDLAAEYLEGSPRPGSDAAEARWVPATELPRLTVNPRTRRLLKERFRFG